MQIGYRLLLMVTSENTNFRFRELTAVLLLVVKEPWTFAIRTEGLFLSDAEFGIKLSKRVLWDLEHHIQNIKEWRISLWWLVKPYTRWGWIHPRSDWTKHWKTQKTRETWNSALEGWAFCDHLWSAIMLSTILDVNQNQKSQMVEPWQPFLLCLVMTIIQ